LFGDVGAEGAVGLVDVVVSTSVDGDGELGCRDDEPLDPSERRGTGDGHIHHRAAPVLGEQFVVVEAADRAGRGQSGVGDGRVQFGHRLLVPREHLVVAHGRADRSHRDRRRRPEFDVDRREAGLEQAP